MPQFLSKNILRPARAPRLPSPSLDYSRENQDQVQSSLRLYFNELDNTNQALFGPSGSRFLNTPYGAFSSDQDQFAVSITDAYAMTFNSTDLANTVSVVSNSRITAEYSGIYNLQFSAQFTNTNSQENDVSIWFRKNGVNIPKSNSEYTIPPRHGAIDGALIAALNFFVDMQGSDYVEIMWSTNSTTVSLQHLPVQTLPTRPATPSVIATMTFVSSIPE